MKKESIQKTKAQLRAASPDTLTASELERLAHFTYIDSRNSLCEQAEHVNEDYRAQKERELSNFKSRGRELDRSAKVQETFQDKCSHMKGGRGVNALHVGGKDTHDYAVLRHVLPNGELWQRCLRCGKTWKPVRRTDFDSTENGRKAFDTASETYKTAISWPTSNTTSSSIVFQWSDGGISAHEALKDTNLR